MRNESALEGLTEKAADGFPASLAIVERPMVHVHSDEFIRQFGPHIPGVIESVPHRQAQFTPPADAPASVLAAGCWHELGE